MCRYEDLFTIVAQISMVLLAKDQDNVSIVSGQLYKFPNNISHWGNIKNESENL